MKSYIENVDMRLGVDKIPDNSIQLILADLPYGQTEIGWDIKIDMNELWNDWWRILKPNGTIVLYGVQPFTSYLVNSQQENFKYSLVWKKSRVGGFAQAPYRFLNTHEDLLVFSKAGIAKNSKNRILYNPQGVIEINKTVKGKKENSLRMGRKTQKDYVQKYTNYPNSILEFKSDAKPTHPTQKPGQLNEYLIKTFTNDGDFILDPCFGSGSAIFAAKNINRNYIGFELDSEYYNIVNKIINE
jgi:site-specific DNA-methyltransferase (adenine-specific)